jgi:hypothetical protein
MKETYNSHILTYSDCSLTDIPKLKSIASSLKASSIKVTQGDIKDLEVAHFLDTHDFQGFDKTKRFSIKLVARNPGKDFTDVHDKRAIERPPSLDDDGLRSPPFFFRHDGSSVDLVNLYRGQSAFLLLNGKSLSNLDLNLLDSPGVITMGVNNGSHLFRPNLWSCVDDPHRFMPSIWMDPRIMKFIPQAHFPKVILDCESNSLSSVSVSSCPNVFGFRRNERFDHSSFLTESTINWGNHGSLGGGRSVMLSSIRILHLLGFRTIYLGGCDFHMDQESKYFFDEARDSNAINNNMNSYRIMKGYFDMLAPVFKRAGLSVYNLNRDSKLTSFPFMDYEEAIVRSTSTLLKELQRSTLGMYIKR